jgi:hypothetical protein
MVNERERANNHFNHFIKSFSIEDKDSLIRNKVYVINELVENRIRKSNNKFNMSDILSIIKILENN